MKSQIKVKKLTKLLLLVILKQKILRKILTSLINNTHESIPSVKNVRRILSNALQASKNLNYGDLFLVNMLYSFKDNKYKFLNQELPSISDWRGFERLNVISGMFRNELFLDEKDKSRKNVQEIRDLGAKVKVTVLVSLYKPEKYISNFLRQLENQRNIQELEVLFILVCGTKLSEDLLVNFCFKYPSMKIIKVNKRVSIYESWNLGILNSSSPLITTMNVDDVRASWSIEHQSELLSQCFTSEVLFGDTFFTISPNLEFEQIKYMGVRSNFPENCYEMLRQGFNVPHHAPMWRRSIHDKLGLFDESYRSAADYEFWLRCAENDVAFLKDHEIHTTYYINPRGISTSFFSYGLKETRTIMKKYGI